MSDGGSEDDERYDEDTVAIPWSRFESIVVR